MRRFAQVDVFTSRAGFGNPVAVVLDAEGLDQQAMARIANWTNLSETTFVLPPTAAEADYRVRIFTTTIEVPMAGHPTLGTCRALIDAGVLPERDEWIQQCAAGLVPVRQATDGSLSFRAPPAVVTDSPLTDERLHRILGVSPSQPLLIDVGIRWLTGRVSVDDLEGLRVDAVAFFDSLEPKESIGVTLYAVDADRVVHVRSIFDGGGLLTEDPVCGSGNAAVGVHLRHTGRASDVPRTYHARQGSHRHRDGRLTVTLGDQVWVGGQALTVVSGTISI